MRAAPDQSSDDLTILLVEDSVGDATALRRAMTRVNSGATLKVATTAEAALPLFDSRDRGFDICLFDINLPGLSGLDLLARVKPWNRNLPILMLSTSQSEAEINRAFALGADGYLVKPYDFSGFDAIAHYVCDCWFDGAPSDLARRAHVVLPRADQEWIVQAQRAGSQVQSG